MANMYLKWTVFLLIILAFCLAEHCVFGFGAGNIPSFAYLEGKAFRHGDIEDTLATLAKKGASGAFSLFGGSKFGGLDIKRIYFGNWLRDYSQAVDITGLKKMQLQSIINLCMALGFLAHGYATEEFEVTIERLGVYLPVEHIDNPKGYGDGEDARKYNPALRPPVDPRELEVDPRTGMKNYIANESGTWDTSKAHVRRTLEKCIHLGRQHRASGKKEDLYEAYRLLGTALHTLEDFSAHSNFCELALVSFGYTQVFTHVGDQVRVQAPNGKWVAPIVTGTFGSSDFIYSLLGEATDHLSEASVSDLNEKFAGARSTASRSGSSDPGDALRDLLFTIPGGSGGQMSREMDGIQRMRAGETPGGKRPEDMSPQELHAVLWQVLSFRDSIMKKIEITIEKIPGLSSLVEKITESIAVFVFTTIEPFMKPLLKSATTGLSAASAEVISNHDQYEVFNDPRASDPTHSILSKDHFDLVLNEPAGNIAKVVLAHTVAWVTKAWDNNSINVRECTEDILQCLFHPDFHSPQSKVQREMLENMRQWVQSLGHKQHEVLGRLSKDAVRNHRNTRTGGAGPAPPSQGSFAATQAHHVQAQVQSQVQNLVSGIPGVQQVQSLFGGSTGFGREYPVDNSYNAPAAPAPQSSYNQPTGPATHAPYVPSYNPPSYGATQSPYGSTPGSFSSSASGGFGSPTVPAVPTPFSPSLTSPAQSPWGQPAVPTPAPGFPPPQPHVPHAQSAGYAPHQAHAQSAGYAPHQAHAQPAEYAPHQAHAQPAEYAPHQGHAQSTGYAPQQGHAQHQGAHAPHQGYAPSYPQPSDSFPAAQPPPFPGSPTGFPQPPGPPGGFGFPEQAPPPFPGTGQQSQYGTGPSGWYQ